MACDDGKVWRAVYTHFEAPTEADKSYHPRYYLNLSGGPLTITFPTQTAKYVMFADNVNREFMRIGEIEIYNDPAVDIAPTTNVAYAKSVKMLNHDGNAQLNYGGYENQYYTFSPDRITDGDITSAGFASGEYQWQAEVDLEDVYKIDQIKVSFGDSTEKTRENSTPIKYGIYTSEDGVIWNEAKIVEAASSASKVSNYTLNFDTPVNAQYIRVKDENAEDYNTAGARIQMAIGEIEVYGNLADPKAPKPTVTMSSGSENGASVDGWKVVEWIKNESDTIKITVEDKKQATSTITIDGENYVSGTNYKLKNAGEIEVVVTTSKDGYPDRVSNFTITVPAPTLNNLINVAKNATVAIFDVDTGATLTPPSEPYYNLSNAVDGDLNTYAYGSNYKYVHTYLITLNGTFTDVAQINVSFLKSGSHGEPKGYDILISEDAQQWHTIKSETNGTNSKPITTVKIPLDLQTVKYIKIVPTAYDDAAALFLAEVEVLAIDPSRKNHASNCEVRAYDDNNMRIGYGYGENDPSNTEPNLLSNVTDDDTSTYAVASNDGMSTAVASWDAEIVFPKSVAKINTIALDFAPGGAPDEYKVMVTSDGFNWEEIATVDDANEHKELVFQRRIINKIRIVDLTDPSGEDAKAMKLAEVSVRSNLALIDSKDYCQEDGVIIRGYNNAGALLPNVYEGNVHNPEDNNTTFEWQNAFDGNVNTQFLANADGLKTVQTGWDAIVDLGQIVPGLDHVKAAVTVIGKTADIKIEVSKTGDSWVEIGRETHTGNGLKWYDYTFTPQAVRYIKINHLDELIFMRVAEVEAYSSGELPKEVEKQSVTDDATAVYRLSDESGYDLSYTEDPANVFDGDTETVSRPTGDCNWMLEADLGEVKTNVNEISVLFGAESNLQAVRPSKVAVQSSIDGVIWRTHAVLEEINKYDVVKFYPVDMRYVRVKDLTNENTVMQIAELNVFQTDEEVDEDLRITDFYPINKQAFVDPKQPMYVIFNKPLRDPTLVKNAIYFLNEGGQPTAGTYSFDKSGTILSLESDLSYNQIYALTVLFENLNIDAVQTPSIKTDITRDSNEQNLATNATVRYYDVATKQTLPDSMEHKASYATDGNRMTVATAQTADPNGNWGIELDLGEVYTNVNQARIQFGQGYITAGGKPEMYRIYTSVDGENWDFVQSKTVTKNYIDTSFSQRSAQFVRIESLNANAGSSLSIGEIEILRNDSPEALVLRVRNITPDNNTQNVKQNSKVTIEFSRSVDMEVFNQAVTLTNKSTGNTVAYTATTNGSRTEYVITPDELLDYDTEYTVNIDKDIIGMSYQPIPVTFKTVPMLSNADNIVGSGTTIKLLKASVTGKETAGDTLSSAAGYALNNVKDKNYNTSAKPQDEMQWQLQLDLGSVKKKIHELRVYFEDAGNDSIPKNFQILYSKDGTEWTELTTVSKTVYSKSAVNIINIADPINARYFRVKDLDSVNRDRYGAPIQMSIAEVEIYQDDNVTTDLSLVSSYPVDSAQGIPVNTTFKLTFNNALTNIDTVKSAIELVDANGEKVQSNYSFESANKVVVIDPIEDLANDSIYKITFNNNILNSDIDTLSFQTIFAPTDRTNIALGTGENARMLLVSVSGEFIDKPISNGGHVMKPNSSGGIENIASHAFDGDVNTSACVTDIFEWQLHADLGEVHEKVNEVRVYAARNNVDGMSSDISILVSADGINYEEVQRVVAPSEAAKASAIKVTFAPRDVRYVRVRDNISGIRFNPQGNPIQMAIGELEVYKVMPTDPIEVTVTPKSGETNVSIDNYIEFKSNKGFVEDKYIVEFTDGQGNPVEYTVKLDHEQATAKILPKSLLKLSTQYTVRMTSLPDAEPYDVFDVSTTFTTANKAPEFKITTTSSSVYEQDRENAIYPAFVDNMRYESYSGSYNTAAMLPYFQLKASGGVGKITWELTNGALPEGLKLSSDGKISGTPSKEGVFSFSVKATDEIGRSVNKTLTMEANPFRAKWYEEVRYGVMVQWGTISGYGGTEHQIHYKEDIPLFEDRVVNFNAEQWAQQLEDWGAKAFNFTVVAGDGVRLWPSTTPSVNELKTERNYVKELIDACHRHGIKFVAYVPGGFNWTKDTMTDYSSVDGTVTTLNTGLVLELIEMGVDAFWVDSDAAVGDSNTWNWNIIVNTARAVKPDIIFGNNAPKGNRTIVTNYPYVDFAVHEGKMGGTWRNILTNQGSADGQLPGSWSPTRKRMASSFECLLQSEWADISSTVKDEFAYYDHIVEYIRQCWANDVTFYSAIIATTDGTLGTEPAKATMPKVAQWVKENINNPAMFGYNKNIVKDFASVDPKQQSYTAFKSKSDMEDTIISTVKGSYDNYDSFVGMEIVSPKDKTVVTHLGRYVLPGNNQKHTLRLIKLSWRLEYMREVEIDLSDPSTYTLGEDGFAYAPIDPIELDPQWVYFLVSSEDNSDTYAKPDFDKLYSEMGIMVSGPAWFDLSGTEFRNKHLPAPSELYYPWLPSAATAPGGALMNFKAFVIPEKTSADLADGSYASFKNIYGEKTTLSGYTSWPQYTVDNRSTSGLAGDGNWEYMVCLDLGTVKHGINQVTVEFDTYYATQYKIFVSTDDINYEQVHHGINSNASSTTAKFDPVDARYIRFRTIKPDDADMNIPGVAVLTKEITVNSNNMATTATAKFMDYQGKNKLAEKDGLSYAQFAFDDNPYTVATAGTAGSSILLDFDGWKDIDQIKIDTQNTELEFFVLDLDGKTWNSVDGIFENEGTQVTFDTPLQAKSMLIRSKDQTQVLEISDVFAFGETSKNPPIEKEPDPEQPPVGGGGSSSGGAGGSSSSGGSDNSGDNTGSQAPTVKPGWAQNADGQWTYGADDGKATIGWAKIDGIWYNFDNEGVMQTGWYKDTDGKWYYFNAHGAMTSGWVNDGNAWYYMNSAGVMQTGWIMVDSKWYYLNSSGAMVTGWRQVGASWYYLKPNGVMAVGWNLIGGKWYYMHSTGSMAFNQWINSNGKWYYVTSDGSMAVNTVIDGYTVDQNGVWVR